MAEVMSARKAFKVAEERRGQDTFMATLLSVQPAMKKYTKEDGTRGVMMDDQGNPMYHDRLKFIRFKTEDGISCASVFPETFLNGIVPEIPSIDGIPVEITAYLNDNDMPQIMSIRYNKADLMPLNATMLEMIGKAGATVKLF